MRRSLTILLAATALTLGACSTRAPMDNAAATGCVPGTPENESASVCEDVTLANGEVVTAPVANDAVAEPSAVANAD